MAVAVPMVVGLGRAAAEAKLFSLNLRHIGKFPFAAAGDGTATMQSPTPGALVPPFSIVTVTYPSPLGPLDDTAVQGPTLPAGTYEGSISRVMVGDPWGSGQGAWVDFTTLIEGGPVTFTGVLYRDPSATPAPEPARTEWMRRGAMLGVAQRAFTNSHKVRVVTTKDLFIQSIEIFKP